MDGEIAPYLNPRIGNAPATYLTDGVYKVAVGDFQKRPFPGVISYTGVHTKKRVEFAEPVTRVTSNICEDLFFLWRPNVARLRYVVGIYHADREYFSRENNRNNITIFFYVMYTEQYNYI